MAARRAEPARYFIAAPAAAPKVQRVTAAAEDAGRRLDLFLASRLTELSRTRIQELIGEGRVRLNERLTQASHRLSAGEVIEIEAAPRPPLSAEPEEIPIALLHEDADFLVVNKPAGMVVHPGAGARSGTLVNALLFHLGSLSGAGGSLRPGIVHRLDRGTSGAILVARNDAAHRALADQFRARTVHKTYLALLHGRMARDAGSITQPIARDTRQRTRMSAKQGTGREARTDWRALLRLGNYTLVAAEPRTGRTHQIRAHFAAGGHPAVGDTLYGAPRQARAGRATLPALGRVFLHAARLEFAHPRTGEAVEVRAPLAPELLAYLQELGAATGCAAREVDAALRGYL
jgi:23S rRNA pseudouridine1911/1915/1917 synthase